MVYSTLQALQVYESFFRNIFRNFFYFKKKMLHYRFTSHFRNNMFGIAD